MEYSLGEPEGEPKILNSFEIFIRHHEQQSRGGKQETASEIKNNAVSQGYCPERGAFTAFRYVAGPRRSAVRLRDNWAAAANLLLSMHRR